MSSFDLRSAAQTKLESSAAFFHLHELLEHIPIESILMPSNEEPYNKARTRPWNIDQQGYPLLIIRTSNEVEVSHAVKFLRKYSEGISVCVASGCHSSRCMLTNTFVIDLANINTAVVNLAAGTVTVGGGALLADMDKAVSHHNLIVPTGTYPWTGVGGLTLGGGFGWCMRSKGLSVDHFIAAEVVLADGTVVQASEDGDNADLMWALRGGGGNFGIVTKFIFRTQPFCRVNLGGFTTIEAHTKEEKVQVLKDFDKFFWGLPDNVGSNVVFTAGSSEVLIVWIIGAENDAVRTEPSSTQTELAVAISKTFLSPTSIKPMDHFDDVQNLLNDGHAGGHLYLTVIPFCKLGEPLPATLMENYVDFVHQPLPSFIIKAECIWLVGGGAMATNDLNNEKCCFATAARQVAYFCVIKAVWDPSAGDKGKHMAREWCRTVRTILEPYAAPIRYAPDEIKKDDANLFSVENCHGYSDALFARLRSIKSKYDETNFFHQNVNIKPL